MPSDQTGLLTLAEAHQIVVDAIQRSRLEGTTILGLLPIETEVQKEIVAVVRKEMGEEFKRLNDFLKSATRGAAAYAIALAPSMAENDSVNKSIEEILGVSIPVAKKPEFSEFFNKACRYLHLYEGKSGKLEYDATILYQTGILTHWIDDLCDAIRKTLKEIPAVDPEDEELLNVFCRRIGSKINRSLSRLIDCLGNANNDPKPLGLLIVKRLLVARLNSTGDQLPPHLRSEIMEAMQEAGVKRTQIAPYLLFNSNDHSLEIVFPEQSKELLTSESRWIIAGKEYSAEFDQCFPIELLETRNFTARLTKLSGGLEDLVFQVKTAIDAQTPLRVFKSTNGKEIKIGSTKELKLLPGLYDVLTFGKVSEIDDMPICIGNSQLIWSAIELRQNDAFIKLPIANECYQISVKETPGLYFFNDNSLEDASVEKIKIYYGKGCSLTAILGGVGLEVTQGTFSVSCEGDSFKMEVPIDINQASISDNLTTILGNIIDHLEAGIHSIRASLTLGKGDISTKFVYWKGLTGVKENEGFLCEVIPQNISIKKLSGLKVAGNNLLWDNDHHGIKATLTLSSPEKQLVFLKPGIHLEIHDAGVVENLLRNSTLHVERGDRRSLVLKTSGREKWDVCSGSQQLVTLNERRKEWSLQLSSLQIQMGHNRTLKATSKQLVPVELDLIDLVMPDSASGLEIETISTLYQASFKIPHSITGLGYKLADLIRQELPDQCDRFPITLPVAPGTQSITNHPNGTSFEVTQESPAGEYLVKVSTNLAAVVQSIYLIDFYYCKNGSDNWTHLLFAEPVGSSLMRLIVVPRDYELTTPDSWAFLLAHADKNGINDCDKIVHRLKDLTTEELDKYIAILTELIHFKYPGKVWSHSLLRCNSSAEMGKSFPSDARSSWLEAALIILGKATFLKDENSKRIWATHSVAELYQRSESRLAPVISGSLYSIESRIYMLAPGIFKSEISNNLTQRCFNLAADADNSKELKEFLFNAAILNQELCQKFIYTFDASLVHDFGRYFRELNEQTKLGGFSTSFDIQTVPLLSFPHFEYCAKKLKKRTIRFRETSEKKSDENIELTATLRRISSIYQRFQSRECRLRELCGYKGGLFDPPKKDNPKSGDAFRLNVFQSSQPYDMQDVSWEDKIVQVIFLLSGFSRLAGYGLISKGDRGTLESLMNELRSFLASSTSSDGIMPSIRTIHSLAPEFYAFFHLFWSIVLKNKA